MTSRRSLGRARAGWPLAASVGAHVLLLTGAFVVAYRSLRATTVEAHALVGARDVATLELPLATDGLLVVESDEPTEGVPPVAHGGATIARVDDGAAGTGGARIGAEATNFAAVDDHLRLTTDLRSHLEHDQHQRLRTASARQSREDRRATTNPTELTFLASGAGVLRERRPIATGNPDRGALFAAAPATRGGRLGADQDDAGDGGPAGAGRLGNTNVSPGIGVRHARMGKEHRREAAVARARPSVPEASVAIPAAVRGRAADTVDTEQAVATAVRSIVHASVAGGATGDGPGGTLGGGDPGAGAARGRGSIARALGPGDGDAFDYFTDDPRLLPYFRKLHAKLDPLWRDAFPRSALLELKQGTVILEFSIDANGAATVSWPPARPSGIDEFDRNCADAIRRASPFEPIPAVLGKTRLRIRAPFVAVNPVVR